MNCFENKETLQEWIESDESEDFRDEMFAELHDISLDEIVEVPYWIEPYCLDNYFVEYIPGYYEPRKYGDLIKDNGDFYIYVDSQLLPEEIEHQADDGGFVYEHRGTSFLRILYQIDLEEDIKEQLIELENWEEIERNVNRFQGVTMENWIEKTLKEVK